MSVEKNKEISLRFMKEVWQNKNFEVVDELMSPDTINHNLPPNMPQGIESTKQYIGMFTSAFPNTEMTYDDVICESDRVVIRWSASGKHEGELMGIPASGKQVKLTGIVINKIQDGKIVEVWGEFDQLAMMQQIGAIPVPGTEAYH
ncbi:MAG: ester cyclase [Crocinitomicaceae bacterium]|nr:ester cyclase [Crocinitomicaceae bacterium]